MVYLCKTLGYLIRTAKFVTQDQIYSQLSETLLKTHTQKNCCIESCISWMKNDFDNQRVRSFWHCEHAFIYLIDR